MKKTMRFIFAAVMVLGFVFAVCVADGCENELTGRVAGMSAAAVGFLGYKKNGGK